MNTNAQMEKIEKEMEETEMLINCAKKFIEYKEKKQFKNNKLKITEWCDNCGMETQISQNGGNCEHCGKYLLPCSLCDMDKVKCNKCKYKNTNNFSKILEKIKKLENLQICIDK